MLALARALMLRPKLLLLDEPSLGLAPIITQQLFQQLAELNKEDGTTMFIVEQNANLALSIAARAYVLEAGADRALRPVRRAPPRRRRPQGLPGVLMLPLFASFINDRFFNWTLIGQLLVNGLKNGAIYAAMALTVVIIYKTTGHLNFAQGEMGALGAFLVYVFAIEHGWPYWRRSSSPSCSRCCSVPAMERTLIRPIERRSALGVVIVTLGVFLILNSLNAVIWGTQQLTPVTPFPTAPTTSSCIAEGPPRFAITLRHDRHLDRARPRRRGPLVLLPEDQARPRLPRRGREPRVEPARRRPAWAHADARLGDLGRARHDGRRSWSRSPRAHSTST